MSRERPEWIATSDDKAIPCAGRKRAGEPYTIEFFRERALIDSVTGCWLWQKATAWNGYGVVNIGRRTTRTHRLCYETVHGVKLSRDVDVCHRCDVRRCVNPDHLFAGSRADNMADCSRKGRIRTPTLKGAACPAAKLTEAQVDAIRSDARSNRALARLFGVNKGTIADIRHGRTWRQP